jgi:inositol transport system substrate-binding protein
MVRIGSISRSKLWLVLGLLIGVFALAACGGGDSDDSTSGGGDTSAAAEGGEGGGVSKDDLKAYEPGDERVTEVNETTFEVPEPSRDYVIGVAFPHFKDPYWISEAYGVQQRADELGVEVRILAATGYGDTATQLDQLDTFLTQGVDALIVGAVDSKGIAPAVDRAWDEGVPVVYANALADSKRSMGVYTDDDLAGVRQAEYIAEKDPKAKVIAMCGPPGVSWTLARCEGLKRTLAELAPEAKVVTERFHEMDRAAIADVAANALEAFPDANWVFNSSDLQAKGVVDALRAKGKKPGDIGITNLTIGEEHFQLMKDGWISYALSERAVLQGQLALDMAVMVLEGEQPPANWAIDLPGYEGTKEDIARFEEEGEDAWSWSPAGYQP